MEPKNGDFAKYIEELSRKGARDALARAPASASASPGAVDTTPTLPPDPADAVRRWAGLLAPGGRLVLVEGFWHTGAGLTGEQTLAAVRAHREHAELTPLTDPTEKDNPPPDAVIRYSRVRPIGAV